MKLEKHRNKYNRMTYRNLDKVHTQTQIHAVLVSRSIFHFRDKRTLDSFLY
jgi:hypothetical protein